MVDNNTFGLKLDLALGRKPTIGLIQYNEIYQSTLIQHIKCREAFYMTSIFLGNHPKVGGQSRMTYAIAIFADL